MRNKKVRRAIEMKRKLEEMPTPIIEAAQKEAAETKKLKRARSQAEILRTIFAGWNVLLVTLIALRTFNFI